MNHIFNIISSTTTSLKLTALVLAFLVFFLVIVCVYQFLIGKNRRHQLQKTLFLIQHFDPSAGLENYLQLLLEEIRKIVETPVLSFYIFDHLSDSYVLKAVRNHKQAYGQVEPSYSGLIPFSKEVYVPPLRLAKDLVTKQIAISKDGEVPLLTIPIHNEIGMVRLGPINRISRKKRSELKYICEMMPRLLSVLVEMEQLKVQTDLVAASEKALHNISAMALNIEMLLKKVFSMTIKSLFMTSGFIIVKHQNNKFNILETFYLSPILETKLRNGQIPLQYIWDYSPSLEPFRISRSEVESGNRLLGIFEQDSDEWYFARVYFQEIQVLLVILDRSSNERIEKEQKLDAIKSITVGLRSMIKSQTQLQSSTKFYLSIMKQIAQTIDNLSPYTIGYSEMMARYSIVIAQELGLPNKEIEKIATAAYLSNIGVTGLSEELYLKDGKYTDDEYEMMKLHVDVGAAVVEMMTGDTTIANLIKHHHERFDGNGYPAGISGEQIPLGSRILATVQTYLAKINGRSYRDPLPFDKALSLLQTVAGTQLDPLVVDSFINWFKKKRSNVLVSNRSLGPCWEMCCVPKEICSKCPAFQQTTKNCWEIPNNNCQAHGKSCNTCFVKTEMLSRYAGIKN